MKVGFIGAGRMAEAMVSSFLNTGTLLATEVIVSDVKAARRRQMRNRYWIAVHPSNVAVADKSQILFLAVKPQNVEEVLTEIAPVVGPHHVLVSIVDGRTLKSFDSFLPGRKVIRVMPNLPCVVGEGMTVFCANTAASAVDVRTVRKLLSCFGNVLEMPEDKFDVVTALSGSGPAFFAYVLDRLIDAGVQEGLDRNRALLLAKHTMLGTSRLLVKKRTDPRDLIKAVASPKGTTEAGLAVLDRSSLGRILHDTIKATARRSKELGGHTATA